MAEDYTSSNFIIKDPVLNNVGGYASSTSFQLFGSLGELSVGTSSATTFGALSGFLGYPFISTPAVSATAGDAQVSLSWTAAQGFLGFSVSGYQVGKGTASGGPYTYTGVGDVTSAIQAGLSNGIPYYFIVRVLDAFANVIATSTEVSATPVASVTPPPGGGGGGGGGGGVIQTGVTFSGRAYPLSKVTVLVDGQIAITSIAGPDAKFSISLTSLSAGTYTFALYGEDNVGRRSSLFTFPTTLTTGSQTHISGIFITPTIATDKLEVKRGDNLAIFGQTSPTSNVTIQVNSDTELFLRTNTAGDGVYLYNLDSSLLPMGQHQAKSKAQVAQEISSFGNAAGFVVGTKTVLPSENKICNGKGDVNNDCRVNLVDYSIVAYWYKRPSPPGKVDFNNDGKVSLVDFSILAYYWTG